MRTGDKHTMQDIVRPLRGRVRIATPRISWPSMVIGTDADSKYPSRRPGGGEPSRESEAA